MHTIKRLLILSALLGICSMSRASMRVTPASGGTAISAETAANAPSPAWTTLGPISLYERNYGHRTRFGLGTNVTFVLKAPAGFEFNSAVVPSVSFTKNKDISAASIASITSNSVTIMLTVPSQNAADSLEIGGTTGLQVRPTATFPLASGNIYRPSGLAGGTAILTGIRTTSNTSGTGSHVSNFGTLTEIAGNAVSLAISTAPSARAVAGLAFGKQPVIAIVDKFGNVRTNENAGFITASLNFGSGALSGTTNIPVLNGLATFTNLTASAASTVTIKFSRAGFAPITSDPIIVDPFRQSPVLTSLAIQTQPSETSDAGVIFSRQPVIKVTDQYDLVVTNDNSTIVTASRGAGDGELQGTLTAQAANGLATFENLSHNVANKITLFFTSGGLNPAGSEMIEIFPAVASHLTFITQPGEATVGQLFGVQPGVRTSDQFGNDSVVGLNSNLLATISLTSGTGPLLGTTNLDIGTDVGDGEIDFTDLAIGSAGTDKQLTVSAPGLVSAASSVFSVQGAPQTISFDALADKVYGDAPFLVSASASSGLPVSFSIASGPATISGNSITIIGTGTVKVRASQVGDQNFDPAPFVDQSFEVTKAAQAITFGTLPDKTAVDGSFNVNATASSGLPVEFSIVEGPASISGNTISITGVGIVTVRASQSGNENYFGASDVEQSFSVYKAGQTISFAPLSDKFVTEAPFSLNASASSGLSVSFKIVSGPATILDNTVSCTGIGTVIVRATQAGNDTYAAAEPVDQSFTVEKSSQSITFETLTNKVYGDEPFTLVGEASSGLPVHFEAVSGPITVSNNTVTITGAGTATILCTQAGDSTYHAASPVGQSFEIARASLVIMAADASRLQRAGNPTLTGTIVGLKNSDEITVIYSTTADLTSAPGEYPITVTVPDPDEQLQSYDITLVNGKLTVLLAAPQLLSNPAGIRINQGADINLSASASGDALSYQWRCNGTNIPDATSSSLAMSKVHINDSGIYDVVISNGAGSITTEAATVKVYLIPCDFDENGQAEIIFKNSDGRLACWYMDGTTFQAAGVLRDGKQLAPGWRLVGQNDFNGDGQTDILFQNLDGRLAIWFMQGTSFVSAASLLDGKPVAPGWKAISLGDFNADGKTDILFRNADGRLAVWYMDGTAFTGKALLRDGVHVAPDWNVAGVRDFNGDNNDDILFQHTDGRLAVWIMNGSSFSHVANLRSGPTAESGWKIRGLSDFNKDQKTDLLWQNADGRVAVWHMNGTEFLGTTLVRPGQSSNPAWRVVGAK